MVGPTDENASISVASAAPSAAVLNRCTAAAATEAATTYYSLRSRRREQRVLLRVSFAANGAVCHGSDAAVAVERSQPRPTAATCFARIGGTNKFAGRRMEQRQCDRSHGMCILIAWYVHPH